MINWNLTYKMTIVSVLTDCGHWVSQCQYLSVGSTRRNVFQLDKNTTKLRYALFIRLLTCPCIGELQDYREHLQRCRHFERNHHYKWRFQYQGKLYHTKDIQVWIIITTTTDCVCLQFVEWITELIKHLTIANYYCVDRRFHYCFLIITIIIIIIIITTTITSKQVLQRCKTLCASWRMLKNKFNMQMKCLK